MPAEFDATFARLRKMLEKHQGSFSARSDGPSHFALEGPTGPATVAAWKGEVKSKTIPVAWVQIGKAYVSYHLMGVYGHSKLLEGCSPELKARMQGKSCFNFKTVDEPLFAELDQLTAQSLAAMRKAGFVAEAKPN